jgi:hypothetical protein
MEQTGRRNGGTVIDMTSRIQLASPNSNARAAGVFYLLSVLTAAFAENFIRGKLLYAVGLIPVLCFAAATLLLYRIFRPVNRSVSLLAALSNLVGLAFEALELHPLGMNMALVFHGIYCLLIGCLVLRSTFLPRILGVLMGLAGVGWLASLSPALGHRLHPYDQTLGFLGEGALMLWLLVMGVNIRKWREKASATS